MAAIGMNVNAVGTHTGISLARLHCTWARIVARRDVDLTSTLDDYRTRGISTLLVLDRLSVEAYGSVSSRHLDVTVDTALRDYYHRYASFVGAWQLGNEPDHVSPSSWTQPIEDVLLMGRVGRRGVLKSSLIVSPGLASGQIDYLRGADLQDFDVIAVHPYLKDAPDPNDIEDLEDVHLLINEYGAFNKPRWITEWGWWGDDQSRGAEEIDSMIDWAAATDRVQIFFYFCLDDAMVSPFGLYTDQGAAKPAVGPFIRQAQKAVPIKLPTPGGPTPPAEKPRSREQAELELWTRLWQAVKPDLEYNAVIHEWGIPTYWREHYPELGSPVTEEIPEGGGPTIQGFASGVLRWTGTEVERLI